MTPQLSSFVATARTKDLSHAAERARLLAHEPVERPSRTRRSWFARLRTARLWQQECAEHQL